MSNLFFISDTHWSHKNVIKYSNRPFTSVEEMDEAMIENWNNTVTDKDIIYHLGDFSFANYDTTKSILKRLRGHKHFLWGNHDQIFVKNKDLLGYFETVQDYKELRWNKQKIVLMHYPLLTWNKGHYGAWHLHGHCHSSINHLNEGTTRVDVGVDNFGYTPISFDEIEKIMDNRTYIAVDHHTETI